MLRMLLGRRRAEKPGRWSIGARPETQQAPQRALFLLNLQVRWFNRSRGEADAHEKMKAGQITERQYYLIAEQAKREEKDMGAI